MLSRHCPNQRLWVNSAQTENSHPNDWNRDRGNRCWDTDEPISKEISAVSPLFAAFHSNPLWNVSTRSKARWPEVTAVNSCQQVVCSCPLWCSNSQMLRHMTHFFWIVELKKSVALFPHFRGSSLTRREMYTVVWEHWVMRVLSNAALLDQVTAVWVWASDGSDVTQHNEFKLQNADVYSLASSSPSSWAEGQNQGPACRAQLDAYCRALARQLDMCAVWLSDM